MLYNGSSPQCVPLHTSRFCQWGHRRLIVATPSRDAARVSSRRAAPASAAVPWVPYVRTVVRTVHIWYRNQTRVVTDLELNLEPFLYA